MKVIKSLHHGSTFNLATSCFQIFIIHLIGLIMNAVVHLFVTQWMADMIKMAV